MNSKAAGAKLHQTAKRIRDLILRHAILGISGIIHNAVADRIDSARIIAAAYRLRYPAFLLKEINHGIIIQINISSKLPCLRIFTGRRII